MIHTKYMIIKRIFDILLSFLAMILLSPLLLVLVVAIKVDSKGPVFFKQKRVGKNKTYFNILKFRTMKIDTPSDVPTHLLENPDKYITRVGKFLRKSSLDELPQVVNIFVGQMSIIGPRPALWNQYDLIDEREKYNANSVKPGLSGWAQANGRDAIEIPDKARLDGYYVKNISFKMDLKCIIETVKIVVNRYGVVEGGTNALNKQEEQAKSAAKSLTVENLHEEHYTRVAAPASASSKSHEPVEETTS